MCLEQIRSDLGCKEGMVSQSRFPSSLCLTQSGRLSCRLLVKHEPMKVCLNESHLCSSSFSLSFMFCVGLRCKVCTTIVKTDKNWQYYLCLKYLLSYFPHKISVQFRQKEFAANLLKLMFSRRRWRRENKTVLPPDTSKNSFKYHLFTVTGSYVI